MTYFLNAEAFRVVKANDRGVVTYRKRYTKGDEVDVTKDGEDLIDPAHLEKLVEAGHLVESEDDLTDPEDAGGIAPTAPPFGAAVPEAPDGTEPALQESAEDGDDTPGSEDEHDVDEYDAMDYGELQATAKGRNVSAGGSAEDIRARLREDDEE